MVRYRLHPSLCRLLPLSCAVLLLWGFASIVTAAFATVSGNANSDTFQTQPPALDRTVRASSNASGRFPRYFLMNQGQADSQVKFLAHGRGSSIFLTPKGLVLSWMRTNPAGAGDGKAAATEAKAEAAPKHSSLSNQAVLSSLHLELAGANPSVKVEGIEELPGKTNFLLGQNPHQWIIDVPRFKKIAYQQVYPGVDLVFYGNEGHLEYDIVLSPGADLKQVKLAFRGTGEIGTNRDGDLLMTVGDMEILQRRPVVYQEVDGQRRELHAEYILTGKEEAGIAVEGYDPGQPLVIDPVLVYASYLGGSEEESGEALAVDSTGNVYVTGRTKSTMDFPVTPGSYQTTYNGGNRDVFIVKVSPDGNATVYATYLGGDRDDSGYGIAVDIDGNAYVTGRTCSSNFPTTVEAFQKQHGGGNESSCGDAFVVKLNAAGDALVYATLLGGGDEDGGYGIAVDAAGRAFVVGESKSVKGPTGFPTTPGVLDDNCSADGFVAKLNQEGSALLYATCLGSSGEDYVKAIALDTTGSAYVAGETRKADFPVTADAFQTNYGGGYSDAFVAKLNATGTALVYATFLGGDGSERATGIAISADGYAFVTGTTYSATGFPTTPGAFLTSYGGDGDAFVTKINKSGSKLVYSSFLGGDMSDSGDGIALDQKGNAYIVGETAAIPIGRFPTTPEAIESDGMDSTEVFVTKMNKTATALLYSTLLPGEDFDYPRGIAVDAPGNAYIGGKTQSILSFPITPNAFQEEYGGKGDAFVAKLQLGKTFRGITVTAPNTGPVWEAGTTQTIRWTYTGDLGPEVRLELLKGWDEPSIITSETAIGTKGTGSFPWTIPLDLPPGTDYRVQITSKNHPEYTDMSNDPFTIRPAPAITVTSPNGGETWEAGTAQTIRWTYEGNTGGFAKIELVAAGAVVATLTPSTAIGKGGNGSFTYTMPASQTPGSKYRILVSSTSKAGCNDASNSNFKITASADPGLIIVTPNGGEKWLPGETQTIQWRYVGNPGKNVKLLLQKGSKIVHTLSKSFPIGSWGTGSFSWAVPLEQAPGLDYRIKIVSTTLTTFSDRSNRNFSIGPSPTLLLEVPKGGDLWVAGKPQEIRWWYTEDLIAPSLTVQLLKGGEINRVITESAPIGEGGQGRFLWIPPCDLEPGDAYEVRLVSSDGNLTDTSNGNFSLQSGPTITIISPNGGETWETGTTETITWTYACAPTPAVKVELLKGGLVKSIVDSACDTDGSGRGKASYWMLTGHAIGNDFRIRVTSLAVPAVSGMSLNDFAINPKQDGPNLVPYQPPGWSDKLVLSRQWGTHTDDDHFSTNDTIYLDWGVRNESTADIETTFSNAVTLDGTRLRAWSYDGLSDGYYVYWYDHNVGKLSVGKHTFKLVADANGTVTESLESDNEYSKVITVREAVGPNLHFYTPSGWSDRIVVSNKTGTDTDDSLLLSNVDLYLDFALINNGVEDIGTPFFVHLYVDGTMTRSFQYDPPLRAGYYTSWVDRSLGKLSGGQHTILLVLDATGVVDEFNEFDNTYHRTITVKAAVGPNLTPYKPSGWSDKIVVSTTTGTHTDDSPLTSDDTLYVDWAVINNGTEATETKFYVGLYVDGKKATDWYCNPPLNSNFYTSISDYALGKLSAGSHTIKLIADTTKVQEEYNETDNEYTRTITIVEGDAPD